MRARTTLAALLASLFLLPSTSAGLRSGSQAPRGVYFALPLWFYSADAVKGRNGNELLHGSLDSATEGAAWNTLASFPLKPIKLP